VLVADMTDPDWEPVMKRAAAIVTNRGGRTCHAAIIARELGIPAVVGCGDATHLLKDGASVTVSCAEGDEGWSTTAAARLRAAADRTRQPAAAAGQDHDERRQSGSCFRLRQAARTTALVWRAWSSSSTA
jgi:phosphoenolpyruvate-protein kinase (PTS system EI component)